MNHAISAFAGFLLAGLVAGAAATHAQPLPQGSYVQTCRDVRVVGGTLLAICRQPDGRWDTSALAEVGSCVGDIGNRNGALLCNRGPMFGSERSARGRDGLREQERHLGCGGIADPIARGRCLHGF